MSQGNRNCICDSEIALKVNIVGQVKTRFQSYTNNQSHEVMYIGEPDYKNRDIVHRLV